MEFLRDGYITCSNIIEPGLVLAKVYSTSSDVLARPPKLRSGATSQVIEVRCVFSK